MCVAAPIDPHLWRKTRATPSVSQFSADCSQTVSLMEENPTKTKLFLFKRKISLVLVFLWSWWAMNDYVHNNGNIQV